MCTKMDLKDFTKVAAPDELYNVKRENNVMKRENVMDAMRASRRKGKICRGRGPGLVTCIQNSPGLSVWLHSIET